MEGFYEFDSQFSESRFPTAVEIKEIKQMLLSGNKQHILQSVEKIKIFLSSEAALSEILMADVSEFLCDAVIPNDCDMVCTLYSCLEMITGHVEFFTYNHSSYAIESVMRTLHFVMKGSSNFICLNQCLNVLNLIMQGYNTHNVSPEKKTIENLLQLLPILQKNLSPTINNKYHVGALMLSLTELDATKLNEEASDIILTTFASWFSLLIETLELEHPIREKLILLTSALCHSILRCLVLNKKSVEFGTEMNENLKNDLIKNISEFLISVGTPFFDNFPLTDLENDSIHLENFYQAILCFYGDNVASEKTRLTHGLSEMGFLQLTTKIISTADFGQCQKLRRLCSLVLFHVILCLSEDVFKFPEIWPNGIDDFRNEVQHGIAQLPIEAIKWLDVLITPEASLSCKLALLLYLYFYSMTARSQAALEAVYPAVVTFIRITEKIESCPLLLKIVWFVFVISQLSCAQGASLESEETDQMVEILEARGDLSLVYTHHPALLYWAFSSKVSSNIQTQTVHLWLRNKTPECKELDQLMRNSSDVRFAILDILQNGWGQELDLAVSSLKSLLMDSEDDDLATSVWFLLPQVLAKFTTDSTSVMNVDYAIELCALRFPQNLDVSRIIRIAYLLPEVLLKSDLLSIVPSLSLTIQLLQAGLQLKDNRVLSVFLRNDAFILKIMEGLHANVSEVSILSIRIIILLWKECREVNTSENRRQIEIPKETILKVLEADCEEVLSAGLELLQVVLASGFRSPILKIKGVDAGFIEILFHEIQNVCMKITLNTSKYCWRCFELFLRLQSGEAMQWEFVTNPLFHELIFLYLPHIKELQELKEFLMVWLDLYNSKLNDPCFGGKIFGGLYSETVLSIGKHIVEDFKQEDQALLEKIIKSGFNWQDNTKTRKNVSE